MIVTKSIAQGQKTPKNFVWLDIICIHHMIMTEYACWFMEHGKV